MINIFPQKKITNNLKDVSALLDELRIPISLVFTPVNLSTEKEKFLNDDKYNPVFQYRIVKNDNQKIFDKLLEVNEISDTDPRISDFYIQIIKEKQHTNLMMNSVGNNAEVTRLSIEKYGMPSPILFRNACRVLKKITSIYSLIDEKKVLSEEKMDFDEIKEKVELFFKELGLEDWVVLRSKNIAQNGVKVGVKAKEFLMHQNLRKRPMELKKTLVHEIGTHVFRSINGSLSGVPALKKANISTYLDIEEGLALINEETAGLMTYKDLKKRALFVWAINIGRSLSFRDLYNALLAFVPTNEAFDVTYRVKRGMGDTSKPGIFSKDAVYFRGFRRLKKKLPLDKNLYRDLYAGKISLKMVQWVREGLIPRPKYVYNKDNFEKIFSKIGI